MARGGIVKLGNANAVNRMPYTARGMARGANAAVKAGKITSTQAKIFTGNKNTIGNNDG